MNCVRAIFIFVLIFFSNATMASAEFSYQGTSVLKFYEILSSEKVPSVKHFFELFGRDNEAELELILLKKFPFLDSKSNWYDNEEAKRYIDKIYNTPDQYPSEFLNCIISAGSSLFYKNGKRLLEFPPITKEDFKIFTVLINNKKVAFEFSQDENTIENIYLPNGKSVYTLIPLCK